MNKDDMIKSFFVVFMALNLPLLIVEKRFWTLSKITKCLRGHTILSIFEILIEMSILNSYWSFWFEIENNIELTFSFSFLTHITMMTMFSQFGLSTISPI
jgi:hypothetical protein